MTGWIKLHRSIEGNEFYFKDRFTRSQAWIDLLLLATHKSRTISIRGIDIHLEPGELCWSQLNLAARWKWNRKTVRKFLSELKAKQMVEIRTNNITTIITLRNWAYYQCTEQKDVQETDTRMDTKTDTKRDTNKNGKNVKKEEYPPSIFEIFQNQEKKEAFYRKDKCSHKRNYESKYQYIPDPEKSRQRLEEIKKLFPEN